MAKRVEHYHDDWESQATVAACALCHKKAIRLATKESLWRALTDLEAEHRKQTTEWLHAWGEVSRQKKVIEELDAMIRDQNAEPEPNRFVARCKAYWRAFFTSVP
jgi:hypothetical protein